ncbi:MAG: hypothetical protein WCL02_02525 [bacterium]
MVTLGTTPTDQLTINYIDQKEYEKTILESQNNESSRKYETGISSIDVKNTFKLPTNLSNVFVENTEKALSMFTIYKNTLYKEFMANVLDAAVGDFIDAADYTKSFEILKNILKKNIKYKDSQLSDLRTLMDRNDLSADEKRFIVDKFKTIFSYITEITDGKNGGAVLEWLVKDRGNKYTQVK